MSQNGSRHAAWNIPASRLLPVGERSSVCAAYADRMRSSKSVTLPSTPNERL